MHPVKKYKFYYIYKITNTINGKCYIGIHAANNLKNRYMGSGTNLRHAIKKYGRDVFTKEILQVFETYDDALAEERRIVDTIFVNDPMTYNIELGGLGGKVWTQDLRNKMSNTKKKQYENGLTPWNKGKHVGNFMTEESRLALKLKMTGSNNHMYGKNVADFMSPDANSERLRKIRENTRKPKSSTVLLKNYAKSRFFIVNQEGTIKHCTDDLDPRLLSGEYRRGKKWR